MPPKRKIAPPIDRPLSKAYLRGFKGWSSAYPPGQSDPATCRVMENVMVERNGAISIRPGLRYLSYLMGPGALADIPTGNGIALNKAVVGTQELFYLENGDRALLFAVRENDGTVGFRVQLFSSGTKTVYLPTDPEVDFLVPQGLSTLAFTAATTYVRYLQINNRILALSDAGEPARMFYVGAGKWAKRLQSVSVPEWEDGQKLTVRHPIKTWIQAKASTVQYNRALNPTFESGTDNWYSAPGTELTTAPETIGSSNQVLEVRSKPTRTNYATSPLADIATYGLEGWDVHPTYDGCELIADSDRMRVRATAAGEFYAVSARYPGIKPGKKYLVRFDVEAGNAGIQPRVLIEWQGADGVTIGPPVKYSAFGYPSSSALTTYFRAPAGAVSLRIGFGGIAGATNDFVSVKDIGVFIEGEATTMFSGDSGTDYFWTGTTNLSQSVYHPAAAVQTWTNRANCNAGAALSGGAEVYGPEDVTVTLRMYTKDGSSSQESTVLTPSTGWLRMQENVVAVPANHVTCELAFASVLARGDVLKLNEAMIVPGAATLPTYFDGNTLDTSTVRYGWSDPIKPHASVSVKSTYAVAPPALAAETPTANTLISSDATKNTYKMAFFYTFENEVGESTPSKLTEIRMMRAWSDWRWNEPGADGPNGAATQTAERCADQLVAQIPQAVYDQAIDEGALSWNLYALTWSDQEPVPVTGLLVNSRPLRLSTDTSGSAALPYADGSWLAVTPSRKVTSEELPLPTRENRTNYSDPPRHRSGLVAGDRMILVGDPRDLASIQWSSNQPAESTNFTPSKGGGRKTLTSGNLNIPADVVLWQNPQSIDTITILCIGDDGRSVAYYMSPATVNQGQSGVVSGMGFEQVSSTPGSAGPYSSQVVNNALFRPLDYALLKSTANNYNINHKTQSDMVSNMWEMLRDKQDIITAQLDNRLYLLVHNPLGEPLLEGCRGNEIWVYDVAAEAGSWSRWLIQASSLNVFSVRNRAYMGVGTPDGLMYLDEDAKLDHYVTNTEEVLERPIEWYFETNTQGANRAHDAWAHLQGLLVTIGNFSGSMRYGIRGQTVNGIPHEVEKEFRLDRPLDPTILQWDVEDQLLVRRDFKEWVFFAGSIWGEPSQGQLSAVQYRYTPVSVNVGYEYGSVETFEYGAFAPSLYAENGIPLPYMDYSQP